MPEYDPALSIDFDTLESEDQRLQHVEVLKSLLATGSGRAAMLLADILHPDTRYSDSFKQSVGASIETVRMMERTASVNLLGEANGGDGRAMHDLAIYYQTGRGGLERSSDLFVNWNERALAAGYVFAANDLYSVYSENGKYNDPARAKQMAAILQEHGCAVVCVSDDVNHDK